MAVRSSTCILLLIAAFTCLLAVTISAGFGEEDKEFKSVPAPFVTSGIDNDLLNVHQPLDPIVFNFKEQLAKTKALEARCDDLELRILLLELIQSKGAPAIENGTHFTESRYTPVTPTQIEMQMSRPFLPQDFNPATPAQPLI